MSNGITQLIATQAQRNRPIDPIQTLARMEGLKAARLSNEEIERDKRIEGIRFFANVKSQLDQSDDPNQKADLYKTAIEIARMNQHDVSSMPNQYDDNAQRILDVAHMQVFNPDQYSRALADKGYQFGSQIQLKDSKGNLFLGTLKKDPRSGIVDSVLTSVDGSDIKPIGGLTMVSGSGMTPEEKVEQIRDIEQTKQDVKLGTEPKIQEEITRAKETVKAEVEKLITQEGELGKLEDADRVYQALAGGDLSKIYGQGESLYPNLLRSQEGVNLMAQRDQIVSMLKLGARGQLAGQGEITDNEQKMLSDAVTVLGNPNISPELARQSLDAAMNTLYRSAGKRFGQNQFSDEKAGKYSVGQIIEIGNKRYRVIGGDMNDPDVELVQ